MTEQNWYEWGQENPDFLQDNNNHNVRFFDIEHHKSLVDQYKQCKWDGKQVCTKDGLGVVFAKVDGECAYRHPSLAPKGTKLVPVFYNSDLLFPEKVYLYFDRYPFFWSREMDPVNKEKFQIKGKTVPVVSKAPTNPTQIPFLNPVPCIFWSEPTKDAPPSYEESVQPKKEKEDFQKENRCVCESEGCDHKYPECMNNGDSCDCVDGADGSHKKTHERNL